MNVLPFPLPRNLEEVDDDVVLHSAWFHTTTMTLDEQRDTLDMLYTIMQSYIATTLSLGANRYYEVRRLCTIGGLFAHFDALVRVVVPGSRTGASVLSQCLAGVFEYAEKPQLKKERGETKFSNLANTKKSRVQQYLHCNPVGKYYYPLTSSYGNRTLQELSKHMLVRDPLVAVFRHKVLKLFETMHLFCVFEMV